MSLSPFESGHREAVPRIVGASLAFHLSIVVAIVVASWTMREPPKPIIPVFELVKVGEPSVRRGASRPRPPEPRPEKPPEIPKPQAKPEAKPQIKPQVKPELPPEIRPNAKPDSKTAEPSTEASSSEPVSDMEMPNDMDMPNFGGMSALRPVGFVDMDPLMQVYLERLVAILMQNFNPPSGTEVKRGTKTSIQFTIERSGQITGITLKHSSGNGVWDQLATRAVKISRVPPLPPNYRAPVLPLVFDFREK